MSDLITLAHTVSATAIMITLIYASYLDIKYRRIPFKTWKPAIAVGVPCAALTYWHMATLSPIIAVVYIIMTALFCVAFYAISIYLQAFGGADAWALILITAILPVNPICGYGGMGVWGYFPLIVIGTTLIMMLGVPICLMCYNYMSGHTAPLRYMLTSRCVPGNAIGEYYGIIMEDVHSTDTPNKYKRELLCGRSFIRRLSGTDRKYYTKYLINHIEVYKTEWGVYEKLDIIWVSYIVPLILPITLGYAVALGLGIYCV